MALAPPPVESGLLPYQESSVYFFPRCGLMPGLEILLPEILVTGGSFFFPVFLLLCRPQEKKSFHFLPHPCFTDTFTTSGI